MSDKPAHLLWSLCVWGERYTDYFLNLHLPSLMQEGNLPALREIAPLKARIYTDRPTLERIAPALKQIAHHFDGIEAEMLPPDTYPHPTFLMSRAQWRVAEIAVRENAALVFSYPDLIVAADSYRHVVDKVKAGARAAFWTGICMREENAAAFNAEGSAWSEVPARDLLAAATNGLHPLTAQRFWPGRIGWPSIMHMTGDGGALTTKTFHPNPVYVFPRNAPHNWQDSLDGTYVSKSGLTWDECARLTDPGFFWAEVAADTKRERQGTDRAWDDAALKAWAIQYGIPAWNQREWEFVYRMDHNQDADPLGIAGWPSR